MRTGARTLATARRLRRQMTEPELLLWLRLRGAQDGPRFRRQHPMGLFILDFYCAAAGLVAEVDGESHGMGERPARDAKRDAWLRARGLEVLRIPAADVYRDAGAVAYWLVETARARIAARKG